MALVICSEANLMCSILMIKLLNTETKSFLLPSLTMYFEGQLHLRNCSGINEKTFVSAFKQSPRSPQRFQLGSKDDGQSMISRCLKMDVTSWRIVLSYSNVRSTYICVCMLTHVSLRRGSSPISPSK